MRVSIALALAVTLAACNPFAGPPADGGKPGATQDTPAIATLRAMYGIYQAPAQGPQGAEADWSSFRSQALAALYSGLPALQLASEEPVLDFDPVVGGQDWEIANLTFAEAPGPEDARKIVTAAFENAGEPRSIMFDMVLENGAWKIDNIRALEPNAYDVRAIIEKAGK